MTESGSDTLLTVGPALAVALVVLAVAGMCVAWLGGTGLERSVGYAAGRATLQLAALGAVIAYVVDHWWLTIVFVALMVFAASWNTTGRICQVRPRLRGVALSATVVAPPTLTIVATLVAAQVIPGRVSR